MSMEARDLEYFVVVAERGNLSQAAELLGLSQPALSKSLRRLEHSAGTKLVKRTPKGVELTVVGSALLTHARRLRLSFDDIAREMSELGQGRVGKLRIGSAPAQVDHVLSPACTAFFREAPRVAMQITVASNDVLLPALRRGEFDVIVCAIPATPYDDLVQERLFDDEFVIFCSVRHRLADRKRITISNLAKERWALSTSGTFARRMLLRMFEDNGFPPPVVVMETDSVVPKVHLVSSTDVLGYFTWRQFREMASRFRLASLPFEELPCIRAIGVSYRKSGYLSPAATRFINLLKKSTSKIAAKK